MKSRRVVARAPLGIACLVLAASVAVTQVSAAAGPDAAAAKKCKKPYVKKRGKCKFTPKLRPLHRARTAASRSP